IGDRFGRVRTLMLTILCYSLFTFLGAVAANVWQLAVFRLLAGLGIGGEWTLGGILVAETLPESHRKLGSGLMHTGYYFGIFLAGFLNYWIGARYGWRAMFAVGGTPALLVGLIRYGVREPERWQKQSGRIAGLAQPLRALFSARFRRRTLLNTAYLLISMTGLWAGSVYVPSSVMHLAARAGWDAAGAARLASWATMLLSACTIAGCVLMPALCERIGRRAALGFFFLLMFLSIALGFGCAFYLPRHALAWFFVSLVFIGVGGANFAVYTLWLPEQYPTACRASAFAFATSAGRFVASGVTMAVGAAVSQYQTIGKPVAWTSAAFLAGLLLLPWGEETKGKPLPE
ncbi:MAG TPA: MFS transporter, partial [Bryobacteraceae bacterium]|nr:MFS transporter [Bryobacteraceae bacterium]